MTERLRCPEVDDGRGGFRTKVGQVGRVPLPDKARWSSLSKPARASSEKCVSHQRLSESEQKWSHNRVITNPHSFPADSQNSISSSAPSQRFNAGFSKYQQAVCVCVCVDTCCLKVFDEKNLKQETVWTTYSYDLNTLLVLGGSLS